MLVYLFESGAKWIVQQVCVELGRLNPRVAGELTDHRQRHTARDEQRCEGVVQIVEADTGQFGPRPHIFPEQFDVLRRLAFGVARKDRFAVFGHAQPDRAQQRAILGRCFLVAAGLIQMVASRSN